MQPLTLVEQETVLNMTADDRGMWEVFSDDPVMQRKLESVGAILVRPASSGDGKFYRLPANQVSFRKPSALTDEQRAVMSARAKARFGQPLGG